MGIWMLRDNPTAESFWDYFWLPPVFEYAPVFVRDSGVGDGVQWRGRFEYEVCMVRA